MLFCHCEVHKEQTRQVKPQGQVSQSRTFFMRRSGANRRANFTPIVLNFCAQAPCTNVHF